MQWLPIRLRGASCANATEDPADAEAVADVPSSHVAPSSGAGPPSYGGSDAADSDDAGDSAEREACDGVAPRVIASVPEKASDCAPRAGDIVSSMSTLKAMIEKYSWAARGEQAQLVGVSAKPKDGKPCQVRIRCKSAGAPRKRLASHPVGPAASGHQKRRFVTTKTGCKMVVNGKFEAGDDLRFTGRIVIGRVCLEHSGHAPMPRMRNSSVQEGRSVVIARQHGDVIRKLYLGGMSAAGIKCILNKKDNVNYDTQAVRNTFRILMPRDDDAARFLNRLREEDKEGELDYAIWRRSNKGQLAYASWMGRGRIELLKQCCDVVFLDCTEKVTRYDMTMAKLVGITPEGNSVVFARALLPSESSEWLSLLLDDVLAVGCGGITVDLIFVDGGKAVQKSVEDCSHIKNWVECVCHFAKEAAKAITSRTADKSVRHSTIRADFLFLGMIGSAKVFDSVFVALANVYCGKTDISLPHISGDCPSPDFDSCSDLALLFDYLQYLYRRREKWAEHCWVEQGLTTLLSRTTQRVRGKNLQTKRMTTPRGLLVDFYDGCKAMDLKEDAAPMGLQTRLSRDVSSTQNAGPLLQSMGVDHETVTFLTKNFANFPLMHCANALMKSATGLTSPVDGDEGGVVAEEESRDGWQIAWLRCIVHRAPNDVKDYAQPDQNASKALRAEAERVALQEGRVVSIAVAHMTDPSGVMGVQYHTGTCSCNLPSLLKLPCHHILAACRSFSASGLGTRPGLPSRAKLQAALAPQEVILKYLRSPRSKRWRHVTEAVARPAAASHESRASRSMPSTAAPDACIFTRDTRDGRQDYDPNWALLQEDDVNDIEGSDSRQVLQPGGSLQPDTVQKQLNAVSGTGIAAQQHRYAVISTHGRTIASLAQSRPGCADFVAAMFDLIAQQLDGEVVPCQSADDEVVAAVRRLYEDLAGSRADGDAVRHRKCRPGSLEPRSRKRLTVKDLTPIAGGDDDDNVVSGASTDREEHGSEIEEEHGVGSVGVDEGQQVRNPLTRAERLASNKSNRASHHGKSLGTIPMLQATANEARAVTSAPSIRLHAQTTAAEDLVKSLQRKIGVGAKARVVYRCPFGDNCKTQNSKRLKTLQGINKHLARVHREELSRATGGCSIHGFLTWSTAQRQQPFEADALIQEDQETLSEETERAAKRARVASTPQSPRRRERHP